jgi:acyl transferase domain-containing protein
MEPIAIIGFSFGLPGGAEDDSSLWQILESGRNVMTEWPSSRANIQTFYSDDPDSRQINVVSISLPGT